VGLAAPNGPGFLAALVGLRAAGHPVLLIDAAMPAAERRRVLERLGVPAVLSTDQAWPDSVEAFRLGRGAADTRIPPGEDLAIIKLTSGSTGDPQGIAAPMSALIADDRALCRSMSLNPDDVFVAMVPFSHSYGFSSLVLPALHRGSPLALPGTGGPFAPLEVAEQLGATVLPSIPNYLGGLARAAVASHLPRSLRLVVSAGAPLSIPAAREFHRRFGRPIHVFYGASECGGIAFDREGLAGERGTVGEPLEGVSVDLEPVGDAEAGGRVVVRSDAVARTYLPAPQERLAGGVFRADDLGSWDGSELKLCGKMGQLVSIHGRKVSPREVERAIAELGGVEDVIVSGGGDGTREWLEAVVACADGELSRRQIIDWCRQQLAPFKVPRRISLVRSLPRDHRGKLQRADLPLVRPRTSMVEADPTSS
jgi:long-chain acyl-CoA synthetase